MVNPRRDVGGLLVMVNVEIDEQKVEQQSRAFGRLMVTDKETRARIRKIIRAEMKDAAKRLRTDAKDAMRSDPRKAFRAVKSTVYRRILGGNVSILNPRKAGARYELKKPRKLDANPYQRGGNRRPVSARTRQIETYFGKDRAFILRFVSSGTAERMTKYGNRGAIPATGWFQSAAPHEMNLSAENLSQIIEDELADAYNNEII